MKVVDVAVAVFLKPDGSFLLSSRPDGKPYAGFWEFPGGKIEPNESVRDALMRELIEELAVVIDEAYPWFSFVMTYPHGTVRLHQWRVTAWHDADAQGMRGMEKQQFRWQPSVDALSVSPTLPGCVPIFRALSLPTTMLVTNASEMGVAGYLQNLRAFWSKNARKGASEGEFVARNVLGPTGAPHSAPLTATNETAAQIAMRAANGGLIDASLRAAESEMPAVRSVGTQQLLQIREKNFSPTERLAFALAAASVAREHGHLVAVNSDIALATSISADGLHLTSADLARTRERPSFKWVGASVHSEEELQRAADLGCDYAVLGAVSETSSHPNKAPLGWERFAALARETPIPVFAIGGLRPADMQRAWQHGAHGIAMQRGAF
jgi:8-oxo-dGTP diphosphatase